MDKSQAEKERKYYNKKLIKNSIESEIKKSHKIDWKEYINDCIGIFLGLMLNDKIGIENHFNSVFIGFTVDVFIIVAAIIFIKIIFNSILKIVKRNIK